MNRSIFQIKKKLNRCIFSLLCSIFIIFFINFDLYVSCISFRGLNSNFLKEVVYNDIVVNCSKDLSEIKVKKSLDIFFQTYDERNVNFGLCKYYGIINNSPFIFNKYSCYSHPNVLFGIHNDLYFNFQFSHNNFNNNFEFFKDSDTIGMLKDQYVCNRFNIYSQNLHKQYLNYTDLNKNLYEPFTNKHAIESQNFIDSNKNDLKKLISKVFKS